MDRASWLLKALHEASGEVHEALVEAARTGVARTEIGRAMVGSAMVGQSMSQRASPGDPLRELAWELATHERSTGAHLEQMLRGRHELALHPAEWLATSADAPEIEECAWIYARARRDTCEMLWGMPPRYLARRAQHPFRGDVSLEDLMVALHERDIETMRTLQRLEAPAPSRPA